jgi:hypothetical protein
VTRFVSFWKSLGRSFKERKEFFEKRVPRI